jgi:N-acetylglucosaminyl-diphospho-decaprenol L-rhamnosyltransferase
LPTVEDGAPVRAYGGALAVVAVVRPGEVRELAALLDALPAALTVAPARTVVADSGTGDAALAGPGVEVVKIGEDAGYAAAANRAIAGLDPRVGLVVLARPATLPAPGALDALVTAAARLPRAGVLGPVGAGALPPGRAAWEVLLRPRRPWPAEAPAPAVEGPVHRLRGGCLLLRRAALDSVDGFDPRYDALADLDLADRLGRAGWLSVQVPEAVVRRAGPAPVAGAGEIRCYLTERNRGPLRAPLRAALRVRR